MPRDRYTMGGAARSVLEVLDGDGVDRATLVGYSMGGRLALYLTLRHPDRCAGLFLESASPGLEGAEERARRQGDDEEIAIRLESGDLPGFLQDWYRQALFAPLARDEDLLRQTIEDKLRNDPAELAASLRGMGNGSQPSLWNELPNLRAPALAVAGGLDEKFVGISRRMASLNAGMRLTVVPGVGHNVHAEAPGAYLSLLESFLTSV
jgi:2-succinyl-6-hydroxy-2,4-cyclohexadiene-1-carboxylate synthase